MPAYPVPPGRRLSYDTDGSQVFSYNSSTGVSYQYTSAQIQHLNSDLNGGSQFTATTYGFGDLTNSRVTLYEHIYFPGPRDLQAAYYWLATDVISASPMQYSTDSVTPGTGTWTNITGTGPFTDHDGSTSTAIEYRTVPVTVTATGVLAVRVPWTAWNFETLGRVHIYAKRSASDTSRQVAFCDSAGVRLTADFDFEDAPRGSTYKWKSPNLFSASTQLYIKNFSGVNTANTVVIGRQANADDTGTIQAIVGETQLSTDDITYSNTITITTLAAGALSGPIYVRWVSLSSDALGVQLERLTCSVGSWT